jgi:transposase InsO family protein
LELNYARSSFYKALIQQKKVKAIDARVLSMVHEIRHEMPNLGGRKLHWLLRRTLLESGHICLGRDRLFDLLRQKNLLIRRKRKYTITTDSNHPYRKYKNIVLGQKISRVNQVWVSDITYIKTKKGDCFVSLITDLYSRKIVGYYTNSNLELTGCLKALKMALKCGTPEIHHSDRGSQYCSHVYTKYLKKYGIKISMTENGNCYENAVAERMNGILKHEFNLNTTFEDINEVKKVLKQSVQIYNSKRPHWALKFKVPDQIYQAA